MQRILAGALVAAIWLGAAVMAVAQDWPARSVRIIVPLAPGGGGDVFARLLAEELQKRHGHPFVVENRPGGALNIGMRACAESPPDGHTLCLTSSEPLVANQFMFRSMPFNAETDFEPVSMLFFNPIALVVSNKLNVKTIPELIAYAKTKPGALSFATFSFPAQRFIAKINERHGTDIVYVPYRSGNEVVNALVSGSTQIAILGLSNMLGQLRSGIITAVAVNANQRSPLFPDLPTIAETGAEDFPSAWFGLFAPRGTPKPVVARIHAEVARIANDPAWRKKNFIDRAIEPVVSTPQELDDYIRRERALMARLFKESGQQPQ